MLLHIFCEFSFSFSRGKATNLAGKKKKHISTLRNPARLSGYPPFWAEDEATTMELTLRGKFKCTSRFPHHPFSNFPKNPLSDNPFPVFSPDWDEISKDAKDFITALIQPDFTKRLTAVQALQHPWILANRAKSDHAPGGENNLAKIVGENLVKHFNAKRKLKVNCLWCFFFAWEWVSPNL